MDASSLNSLEKAQAAQTGVVQKNRSWREVTAENSDEYKEIQNVMNEGEGNVENMLKKLGGIKRTLTFADGETTKEVYIHVPDDEVSDGQVQAMFALTNAENIEISDAKTGYIVISDDEKGNKPEYELSKSSYSVSSAKDSVTVTVKKTAGTEQLSVANIVTSDGTAFDGINYEGVSESLIFPKGVKEKKVTIPIISSLSEDKYFFVGLGDEQGKTDESKLSTVTIKADKKSKASTGANTVVTSSGTEFTYGENYIDIDLSQWTLHSRYRNGGTYGSESGVRMDLRNVKKNLFKNWTDWGNGKQGWDVKVSNGRGDDVCLGSYSNNRTEHISNPVKVRNPDGSSFSTVYDLYVHEFNQTEKNKTFNGGMYFVSSVWYRSDSKSWGGNNNLSFIRIVYDKVKVSFDSTSTNNYYLPKTYTSKTDYTFDKSGIFLADPKVTGEGTFTSLYDSKNSIIDIDNFNSNKTESGVSPSSKNVKVEGFKVGDKLFTDLRSGVMAPEEAFDYARRAGTNNLKFVPQAKPRTVNVHFKSGDDGACFTNFKSGSSMDVSVFDKIKLSATCSDKHKGIIGFSAVNELTGETVPVKLDEGRTDSGYIEFNDSLADGSITIVPLTGPTSLTIMPHPLGKNLKEGYVMYVPDTALNQETEIGDMGKPINVPDPYVGASYTILGEGYKPKEYIAFWEDGSADTNGDGIYSEKELENYYGKDYKSKQVPEKFRGDVVDYRINTCGAKKLYYQFRKADGEDAPESLRIFGKATYTQQTIFGTRTPVTTDLSGATITAAGDSYVTGPNPLIAKGTGCFTLYSKMFNTMDTFFVTANATRRDGSVLTMKTTAYPGTFKNLEFFVDSTLTIDPVSFEKYITNGDPGEIAPRDHWEKLTSMTALKNDDHKYRITVKCGSKDPTRRVDEATLHFYNSEGEPIMTEDKDGKEVSTDITKKLSEGGDGVVAFEFTPSEIKAPKNTYLTIQLKDQYGSLYPEQKTGYVMYESMGAKTLAASFKYGGAFSAVALIGNIQGDMGTRWNGSLDEGNSSNVSASEEDMTEKEYITITGYKDLLETKTDISESVKKAALERVTRQLETRKIQTLTLTLGITLDKLKKDMKSAVRLSDMVRDVAAAQKELARAMKDYATNPTPENKKTLDAKEAASLTIENKYYDALEHKTDPEKTTKEFNPAVKVNIGFVYVVSFKLDEITQNWYFDYMLLTATVNGSMSCSWKFVTPIGITISIAFKAGGRGTTTVAFTHKQDKKRYYLKTSEKSEAAIPGDDDVIDLIGLAANGDDIDTIGVVTLKPYIEVVADAEFAMFEVEVSGRVDLNLAFTTTNGIDKSGSAKFGASITVSVFQLPVTWHYVTPEVPLFGSDSPDMSIGNDADRLYGSSSRFLTPDSDYVNDRSGWKGDMIDNALDEDGDGVIEKLLQEKIFDKSEVSIKKLNDNGDYLGVFTDIDKSREDENNKSTAYWSLYTEDTKQWSEPKVIDDDNTFDTDVRIVDLGNRGLFVIWCSSSSELTADMKMTDRFNKLEIKGAFFDKSEKSFVKKDDKINVLKVTDDKDSEQYSDSDPCVIYNADTMLIYYTKSKYAVSDEDKGEAVGDAIYPESTSRVFRTYNFSGETGTDGSFVDNYDDLKDKSIAEDIKDSVSDYDGYNEKFYGQVFVNSVPDVYINEKLNDEGMWAEEPEVYAGNSITTIVNPATAGGSQVIGDDSEITGTTYKAVAAPYIIDHDAISYGNTGIFAYVADYDNNLKTVNDRELFFQTYDFETGEMSHPIIVTNDNIPDSNVRLTRQNYTDKDGNAHSATILSWLSNNMIKALDISNVIDNLGEPRTLETEDGNIEYYLIEKTEEAGYVPPTIIASGNPQKEGDSALDSNEITQEDKSRQSSSIAGFDVYSVDGYDYYVWTVKTAELKKGIDSKSIEASDVNNSVVETQIYMVRNDLVNETKTFPVQVTSKQGVNYEDVRFAVNGDGTLKALAVKSTSDVVTVDEFNDSIERNNAALPKKEQMNKIEKDDFVPYNDVSKDKNLVALDITPISRAKLRNTDSLLNGVVAGGEYDIEVPVLNDGVDTLNDITLTATDKDGNSIVCVDGEIKDSVKLDNIVGGFTEKAYLRLTTDKDDDSAEINLTLTDKDGNEVDKKSVSTKFESDLTPESCSASLTNTRDKFDLSFTVSNVGTKASSEQNAEYGVIDRNGSKVKLGDAPLRAFDIDDNEEIKLEGVEVASADYFTEKKDDDGNLTETGTFYVTVGEKTEQFTVIRTATADQVEAMDKVKNVTFTDGDKVEAVKDSITATNLCAEGKTIREIGGVRAIYESEDTDVFTVNDEGTIYGIENGTAKLKATILPQNSDSTASYNGGEGENGVLVRASDNFAKVPSSLIKTFTTDVKVSEEEQPTTEPATTEPTTTEPVTTEPATTEPAPTEPVKPTTPVKVVKNGVTYKSVGNTAAVIKSDKSQTSVVIPNKVKIGSKNYKVTKINSGVFKNSAKLRSVAIGDNVSSIGSGAFYGCNKLAKVTTRSASKLRTIGSSAFGKCVKLTSITIPKSVTKIGAKAFFKASRLKKVSFKRSVPPTIGKYAFKGIYKKAVFDVPNKSVGKYTKKLKASKSLTSGMTVK